MRAKFINKRKEYRINHDNPEKIRLNKYISNSGTLSRREADIAIENGRVIVNGRKAKIGEFVKNTDTIKLDGKKIVKEEDLVYMVLNKPRGIICTTDRSQKGNIVDYISHEKRIFPIGRLDKESQGVILITNDGDIVNKLLRSDNHHEKEYMVYLNKQIDESDINKLKKGVRIFNPVQKKYVFTKKCRIEKLSSRLIKIVLKQGLNRQIRRMLEVFGYKVTKLERVRFINIKIDKLKTGEIRYLEKEELKQIEKLIK